MILQTEHWTINHRVDSALPGYLMLASRMHTNDLEAMSGEALQQLGALLASAQRALSEILMPQHLYIGRYGHSAGLALHFHVIPICAWVNQGFLADPRYRVLRTLANRAEADREETDGAELTLYVWREFCESATPPAIQGLSIHEVIEQLRTRLSAQIS
jgi:diadenosine tetraphosphate (Ap4A) HIT family hydrolase